MHCLREHRIEYRREVAGRRIDDLQHLGGGGLLVERLAQGLIGCFALADIADRPDQSYRSPGRVSDRDAAIFDPAILPIAMSNPIFAIKTCRDGLETIMQCRSVAREVLRMD